MSQKITFCPLCSGRFEKKKVEPDGVWHLICIDCEYTYYQNPTPTVLAIIERDNQLLLVKRKYEPHRGLWSLPGGFLNIGQNLEAALMAEIGEELGVGVESATYFNSSVSSYQIKHLVEDVVGVAFRVVVDSYDFTPGSDAAEVKFFDKNNLPPLAPFQDAQDAISKLIKETHDNR